MAVCMCCVTSSRRWELLDLIKCVYPSLWVSLSNTHTYTLETDVMLWDVYEPRDTDQWRQHTANDLRLGQQGQTNGKQKQTSQGRGKINGEESSWGYKKTGGIQKKLRSKGTYDEESLIGRKTKDGRALGESEVKYGVFFVFFLRVEQIELEKTD